MNNPERIETQLAVRQRRTALLFRNGSLSFLTIVFNALLLAFVNVHLGADAGSAYLWSAIAVAAASYRFLLVHRFQKATPQARDAPQWYRAYFARSIAVATVFGAGSALLFVRHAPQEAQFFTALMLGGNSAGAVSVLGSDLPTFRTYVILLAVPLLVVVALQAGSPVEWALAAVCFLFLIVVLGSARHLHNLLESSLRLGIEQQRLAQHLTQARETLQESEERYRQILQHSPAGIFHFDSRLVLTYCNERLAQIIGAPRERLIGMDMSRLSDQRPVPALMGAIEGRETVYEGEYLPINSGKRLWITAIVAPFRSTKSPAQAGGIAIVHDKTEQHRAQEEIRRLALYDPLTGLPNRRLLMDRLAEALHEAARHGRIGAVMMLDLDQFKRINDTQGHDAGDRLLVEVARRIERCLRRGDLVARVGGDEYVVLAESLGEDEAAAAASAEDIAERIRASIQQPFSVGGAQTDYFGSTSIGFSLFHGRGEPPETLLKQADVALYQAKGAGRNAVARFGPSMQARVDRRANLESALRRGLERGEFRLFFQPLWNGQARPVGAEALIRWFPDDGTMVSPAEFIPIAEETGLIHPIGRWVIEAACRQLDAWAGHPEAGRLQLAVNVSARQFHQPEFVAQLREIIARTGADPRRLVIELTESAMLDSELAVIQRMEEIHAMGIGFALDDFGTGYSSLSYLQRLPLERIKIDRSFVQHLPGSSGSAAIVEAILGMTRSLGLTAVAEGVETLEQLVFLQQHGCPLFQGYLYGRPVPLEAFEALLARDESQTLPGADVRPPSYA